MAEETLQEAAERLKDFPGNVKGEVFRVHAEYIKYKEGEEGVRRVEEKMAELGAPIKFSEIKPFDWVNEGFSSLSLVTAKEIFNWSDEDIFEMGRFAPKFSFIIKIMIQYLVSVEVLLKNAEKYWSKHFDFGSIETDFVVGEKRAVVRERNPAPIHPVTCTYHRGYFTGLCDFAVKGGAVTVKETSCVHKGDEYHEFLITWE
jgi:hypothetical protein